MKKPTKNDLSKKFGKGTVAIHWVTAILILILIPMGKYMSEMDITAKINLIRTHVLLGAIVFVLTTVRSVLFFKAERPPHIKTGSVLNDKLYIWIHNAFYFVLFGISVSGIATLFLGGYVEVLKNGNTTFIHSDSEIASLEAHETFATILLVLLMLHVVGVIKHYILTRENTLKRIV